MEDQKKITLFLLASVLCLYAKGQHLADFSSTVQQGCTPLLVAFIDQSSGNHTKWQWDLGNGSKSTEKNPSAIYTTPGTYSITLYISDATGEDSVIKKDYITVYQNPSTRFEAKIQSGCIPLDVQFTDSSQAGSGTVKTWTWDFGDGITSDLQNPEHTYTLVDTFNVSLTVANNYGCKNTLLKPNLIEINNRPTAVFIYKYDDICKVPAIVNFNNTNQSSQSLTYEWDFGDGTKSTLPNPLHTYSKAGNFTIVLKVTNSSGCTDMYKQSLSVGTAKADFNVTNYCVNTPAVFTANSNPVPLKAAWDFGDGQTQSGLNVTHVYETLNSFKVTLTADFGGCRDTISKTITTLNKPIALFTGPGKKYTCAPPVTMTFTNNSENANNYQWTFGDGTETSEINPTHTYTKPGKYDIILTASNEAGCPAKATAENYVQIGEPKILSLGNSKEDGCAPETISFKPAVSYAGAIKSYLWDFGDGSTSTEQTPNHLYSNAGIYNVRLIIITEEGCTDTMYMPEAIRLGKPPVAEFSAEPVNACAETIINFKDASQGNVTSRLWLFGDSAVSTEKDPSHRYTSPGYFDVMLIAGYNGCYDTAFKKSYVYLKPPVARFTTTGNCDKPYVYTFTDKSFGAQEWFWNFGDNTTANGRNQTHTYKAKGIFHVTLTVSNGDCSYTIADTVNVVEENPSFSYEMLSANHCKYDSVLFTATQYNPENIKSLKWVFGDDVTVLLPGTKNNYYYAYQKAGTFKPVLIAKDINNCSDTIDKNINIKIYGPIAAFSNKPGSCISSTIDFKDASTSDGTYAITKWIWNFGDGTKSDTLTTAPFQHTYNTAGKFPVKLKILDNNNCYDTLVGQTVSITDPEANFIASDTISCADNNIQFTDYSQGVSLNYKWSFGDGQYSTEKQPSHLYARDSTYTVKLLLTDVNGCTDSLIKSNYLSINTPVADFKINDSIFTCPPGKIVSENKSSNYNSILWEFGDGNSSLETQPIHYYTQAGTYNLKLRVNGFGKCFDTSSKKIIVKGPSAKLSYSPTIGCDSQTVTFSSKAENTVKYIWDFGNGVVRNLNATSIKYKYIIPGKFLPKLLIEDATGCRVAVANIDTVTISHVEASFLASRKTGVCDSSLFDFTSTSNAQHDVISSYKWQYGDGDSSANSKTQHYYNKEGTYKTSLKLLTKNGCSSAYELPLNISIDSSPKLQATMPDSLCSGSPASLTANIENDKPENFSWNWNLGDGTSAKTNNTNHAYSKAGIYNVLVTATSRAGCSTVIKKPIVSNPLPLIKAGDNSVICRDQSILLKPSGANNYTWVSNATLSCINCNNPVASPLVNTTYYVTGINSYGCSAKDSVIVAVKQPIKISITAPDTICLGTPIKLKAEGAEQYKWLPPQLVSNSTSAEVSSLPTSSTNYSVIGTDNRACFADTATVFVKVYPIPSIQMRDSLINLSAGSEYKVDLTGSQDITSWRWDPPVNISCSNCPEPVITPKNIGVYRVQAFNDGGCFSEKVISFRISCSGSNNLYIPNTFSPNGDGMNDYFYPRGKGLINIKSLRIFNRWGALVYQRTNFAANQQSSGWNGNYNNRPVQTGVYVFVIEITCENGQLLSSKGDLTLIR